MTTPTCSTGKRSASSSAWRSVDTTPRSAQNSGCMGSIASCTPSWRRTEPKLGDPLLDPLSSAGRSREPVGEAPTTMTRHPRAQGRRLVDGLPVVADRSLVVFGETSDEAAAAHGRHAQPRVGDDAACACQ